MPDAVDRQNLATYKAPDIVGYYAQLRLLQPAEAAIRERLRAALPQMKMLDLGIGGGRTTTHFAPLVREYVGLDYSTEMIAACRRRFAGSAYDLQLTVGDARDLSRFSDNSFDFILFSFNGLDYVTHSDRLQILKEIRRVGKPGGHFCFSSHNLRGIAREFDFRAQMSWNPLKTYTNLVMTGLLRLFNPDITRDRLIHEPHLLIRDEPHNFRLWNYYIRPETQLAQLEAGFDEIEVYSWREKTPLNASELITNTDLWLYYFCKIC